LTAFGIGRTISRSADRLALCNAIVPVGSPIVAPYRNCARAVHKAKQPLKLHAQLTLKFVVGKGSNSPGAPISLRSMRLPVRTPISLTAVIPALS